MNCIAGLGVWPIQKHVDTLGVTVNKACVCERHFDAFKVGATDQNIDIARDADRRLIDARHPGGDGIAADDGVGNSGIFECTVLRGTAFRGLFPRL